MRGGVMIMGDIDYKEAWIEEEYAHYMTEEELCELRTKYDKLLAQRDKLLNACKKIISAYRNAEDGSTVEDDMVCIAVSVLDDIRECEEEA
jgi:hypothetical protein